MNPVAKHAYKFNKSGEIRSIKEYKKPKYPILADEEYDYGSETERCDTAGECTHGGCTCAYSSHAAAVA